MATLSGWSSELPANTSIVSQFDDTYRSDKSSERSVWDHEHFFDTGSSDTSAGAHRIGAARVHYGTASSLSTVNDPGRLYVTSDSSDLFSAGSHEQPQYLAGKLSPVVLTPWDSSLGTTHVNLVFLQMYNRINNSLLLAADVSEETGGFRGTPIHIGSLHTTQDPELDSAASEMYQWYYDVSSVNSRQDFGRVDIFSDENLSAVPDEISGSHNSYLLNTLSVASVPRSRLT